MEHGTRLWCDDCGSALPGVCETHGELTQIKDRTIPSRAKLTLPHNLTLKIQEERPGEATVYGVFSKRVLHKRTQFGPVVAPELTDTDIRQRTQHFRLKVLKPGGSTSSLDLSDEDQCNWMMFVRPAKSLEEQNMVAYQYKEGIYYTTTKNIHPYTELKVGYAGNYSKIMNTDNEYDICSPIKTEKDMMISFQADDDDDVDDGFMSVCDDISQSDDHSISPTLFECSNCNQNFQTSDIVNQHRCGQVRTGTEGRRTRSKKQGKPVKIKTNDTGNKVRLKTKNRKTKSKQGQSFSHLCEQCSKAFPTADKLRIHTYQHSGERPFECKFEGCSKAFTSGFKLLRHEKIHRNARDFKCSYCEKEFNRKDHLKLHLQSHDPNRQVHKCHICDKSYTTPWPLKVHLVTHDVTDGVTVCRVCNKDCETPEGLSHHLKHHTQSRTLRDPEAKQHCCSQCKKKFYTLRDLKRHSLTHTNEKNYLCQFCPTSYGRKDHLTRHMRMAHSGCKKEPEFNSKKKKKRAKEKPKELRNTDHILKAIADATSTPVKVVTSGIAHPPSLTTEVGNQIITAPNGNPQTNNFTSVNPQTRSITLAIGNPQITSITPLIENLQTNTLGTEQQQSVTPVVTPPINNATQQLQKLHQISGQSPPKVKTQSLTVSSLNNFLHDPFVVLVTQNPQGLGYTSFDTSLDTSSNLPNAGGNTD